MAPAMRLPWADDKTLSLQLGFTCNSRCSFCIISDKLEPYAHKWPSFAEAARSLMRARKEGYHKVIVTGGEVTLYPRLPQMLRLAKTLGLAVMVQTNGRRLAKGRYARLMAEIGVDEFFVSMHAESAELHDRLTQAPGSFDQAWRGIENLLRLGVHVITNTVIVKDNFNQLPESAAGIVKRGVRDLHFWFITPMGLPDKDGMIPRVTEVGPYLQRAVAIAEAAGAKVTVKYFPVCHLGPFGSRVDNSQAFYMIASDPLHTQIRDHWRFHCPHEKSCPVFDRCGGLTKEYVRVHGVDEVSVPASPETRSAAGA
jgi:MoaA/NifB/PqqE/SkfB family radical SAM enzyme